MAFGCFKPDTEIPPCVAEEQHPTSQRNKPTQSVHSINATNLLRTTTIMTHTRYFQPYLYPNGIIFFPISAAGESTAHASVWGTISKLMWVFGSEAPLTASSSLQRLPGKYEVRLWNLLLHFSLNHSLKCIPTARGRLSYGLSLRRKASLALALTLLHC